MKKIVYLVFVVLFAVLLESCAGAANEPDINSSLPTEPLSADPSLQPVFTKLPALPGQGVDTPMPTTLSPVSNSASQAAVDIALNDMAGRLSISATEIKTLQVLNVTWADSSLGCAMPGNAALQVLTPGYLILLEYKGSQYEYHASKNNRVVYCTNPSPPAETGVEE